MVMMKRAMVVVAAAVPAMFALPAIGSAQPTVCAAESLKASAQPEGTPSPDGQNTIHIVLTNTGPESCMVQGYPGADLAGPDDPQFGPTYSLTRQETGFAPVTVDPGASVVSDLTYLADGPDGWTPNEIVITPPDTETPLELAWPNDAGSVARQDGATHPGSFIGPLRPA